MNEKQKAYICLHPLKITSSLPIEFPKGMLYTIGVFKTKKDAQKFGETFLEVEIDNHN